MYKLTIPDGELYDPKTRKLTRVRGCELQLEHSLLSMSKWEEEMEKPLLKPGYAMTEEERIFYIKCMTINHNVPDDVYKLISSEDIRKINEYIQAKRSATTFNDDGNKKPSRKITTSEEIYGWMITLRIPKEFEKWHLNRLLTLIRVVSIQNSPPKKMSHQEALRRYDKINEQRRNALNSRG